jgi:hypothetical protein
MTSPAPRSFGSASCPCSWWVPACWAEAPYCWYRRYHHYFTDFRRAANCDPGARNRHSDNEKFCTDLNGPKTPKMSERPLKTLQYFETSKLNTRVRFPSPALFHDFLRRATILCDCVRSVVPHRAFRPLEIAIKHCKMPNDELHREFKFFNLLAGGVCTTCAPGDPKKSRDDQRERAELNSLRSAGVVSGESDLVRQADEFFADDASGGSATFPELSCPNGNEAGLLHSER